MFRCIDSVSVVPKNRLKSSRCLGCMKKFEIIGMLGTNNKNQMCRNVIN